MSKLFELLTETAIRTGDRVSIDIYPNGNFWVFVNRISTVCSKDEAKVIAKLSERLVEKEKVNV